MKKRMGLRWMYGCVCLLMMASMLAGCFAHDETIIVEKKSWSYNLRIEKKVLCFENDWTLPDGAILIRTEREKYDEIYDEEGNFERWEYRTKYYYQIWRWKYERDVSTSGYDEEPYFGEPNLKDNERIDYRTTYYYVHGRNSEEETVNEYSLSFDDWLSVDVGDVIEAKVSVFFGSIKEIYEIRKPLEAVE